MPYKKHYLMLTEITQDDAYIISRYTGNKYFKMQGDIMLNLLATSIFMANSFIEHAHFRAHNEQD